MAGWAPRIPGLPPSLLPSLTQVDEAHDHVGVVEEGAVLRAGQRRGRGRLRARVALRALGQGVVEVQHEARCRSQPSRRRGRRLPRQRPGPVGQPQHREDLPLHLPLLVRLQPPVEEARAGGGGRRRLPALGGQRGLGGAAGAAQQRPAAAQPGQPARHGARPGAGGRRPRSALSPRAARRPPALPPRGGFGPGRRGAARPGGLSARRRAWPPAGQRAAEPPAPNAAQVRRGRPRPAAAAQRAMPLPGGSAPGRGGCGRWEKEQGEEQQTFLAARERGRQRASERLLRLQPRSPRAGRSAAADSKGKSAARPPLGGAGGRSSGAGSGRR